MDLVGELREHTIGFTECGAENDTSQVPGFSQKLNILFVWEE